MKTFEEKFTAWVDGKLSGAELADFENEIASQETARTDKFAAQKVGNLLRTYVGAPELKNADFFNHQLMQQIEAEQAAQTTKRESRREKRAWSFWTLPRMAFTGASCLVLATALYFAAVPKTAQQATKGQQYVAKILSAHSDDPNISATSFHSNEDNATVLWLDGLDYIPENYKLK
jgi:hypothetical protein